MEINAFEAWNVVLLGHFFRPEERGREVFIGTTPDVLDEIGGHLGGDAGLLRAVKAGPDWKWKNKPSTLESRLLELVERRTNSAKRALGYTDPGKYNAAFVPGGAIERSAPTYLPFLAALARGAAVADSEGYYAALRRDVDLPTTWGSAQMSRTEVAWTDLDNWTKQTLGQFGTFTFRRLGGYQFVGLARSQVMVAARDVTMLYAAFDDLGVMPGKGNAALKLDEILLCIQSERSAFSRGLRQAALDPDYREILIARILDIHGDWTLACPSLQEGARSGENKRARRMNAVKFGISLGSNDDLPWRLAFRIDDGAEPPEIDERTDSGELDADNSGLALWRRRIGGWLYEPPLKDSSELLRSELWRLNTPRGNYLVERPEDPTVLTEGEGERYQLWESGLPEYGGATILFPTCDGVTLSHFQELFPEMRAYSKEDMQGLPPEWTLYRLEACEHLTEMQRSALETSGRAQRLLVLQGGTKDGGQFLHYDLPDIVYRGPRDWRVVVVGREDLRIDDYSDQSPVHPLGKSVPDSVSRRYILPAALEEGGEYKFAVLDADNEHKGGCSLSVQPRNARSEASVNEPASLDRFGRISKTTEGLRGGLPAKLTRLHENGRRGSVVVGQVNRAAVGKPTNMKQLERCTAVLFLDSLSRAGSYSYGGAKARLDRLLSRERADTSPPRVMVDLWRRGYLELERGQDGGIERVHAVPPCAYELPLLADDRHVFGLLGSLSLSQWESVCTESLAWELLRTDFARGESGALPILRLVSNVNTHMLEQRLLSMGIGLLPMQSLAVANWSASEREVRSKILSEAREISESVRFQGLKRFDPLLLRYADTGLEHLCERSGMKDMSVYQFEDSRRKGWKRSFIVTHAGFSFSVDEQWLRWVALSNVARGMKSGPIAYDRKNRYLYVPTHIRFPIVIDRALILCSGGPPIECRFDAWEDGRSVKCGIRRLDTVFFELEESACQGIGTGSWLRYENVPEAVLKSVISKGK